MNLQAEKLNLIQTIIGLQDKNLVLELKYFLQASLDQEEMKMKPMSLETFYARIDQAEKDFEEGNVISHEDLKKEVKTWGRKK